MLTLSLIPIFIALDAFFSSFIFRSRLSHLQSESTLYGLVDLFLLLSAPSKISGAPSKSMTNPALVSFTAVSHFIYLSIFDPCYSDVVIVECFNLSSGGYEGPAVSAPSSTQARTEYSKRKAEEFEENCGKIWEPSYVQVYDLSIGTVDELIFSLV